MRVLQGQLVLVKLMLGLLGCGAMGEVDPAAAARVCIRSTSTCLLLLQGH